MSRAPKAVVPKKRRRMPVTGLLVALIVAVAAPSLVFSALLLLQSDRVTRSQMSNRAAQSVERVADAMDNEFRSSVNSLSFFAASGWMETEAYVDLHAQASRALEGTNTFLIAVDGQGRQLLNTRVPFGTPLNATSDPESTRRAITSDAPAVSNVFFGQVAQRQVFNVTLPIRSLRPQARALIITRNIDTLPGLFANVAPPAGWHYAVIDGAGRLAAGDAPRAGADDLLAKLCQRPDATPFSLSEGGVDFAAASRRVDPWGWRACVWSSSDEVETQITDRWRAFVMIVLTVVAASIAGGALLGRLLTGGISRAAAVGRALDAGGDVPEQHSLVREVDDVLGTLTRAAQRRLGAEQDLRLLQRETAHRAKNQIAIAIALTRLSARASTSVEQLREDISARLTALSRSIDMMASRPGAEAPVRELAEVQLEPFVAGHPERLELVGEDVLISPTAAQALGLVLHEKATNASKYGSWSVPEGRVRFEWRIEGGDLVLVWTELGGPPPAEQRQTGFGSSLIEMLIERNLGGGVKRDYQPTGLVATFRIPKDAGAES